MGALHPIRPVIRPNDQVFSSPRRLRDPKAQPVAITRQFFLLSVFQTFSFPSLESLPLLL